MLLKRRFLKAISFFEGVFPSELKSSALQLFMLKPAPLPPRVGSTTSARSAVSGKTLLTTLLNINETKQSTDLCQEDPEELPSLTP